MKLPEQEQQPKTSSVWQLLAQRDKAEKEDNISRSAYLAMGAQRHPDGTYSLMAIQCSAQQARQIAAILGL